MLGAILLVIPHAHTVCAGAALLSIVMLGAITVDSLVLKRRPYLSVAFLILMATVAWVKANQ